MKTLKELFYKEDGVTLIELILAVAIMSFVILALNNFYLSFYNLWDDAKADSSIIEELNLAKNVISKDVRSALKPDSTTDSVEIMQIDGENRILNIYRLNSDLENMLNIQYELTGNGEMKRKSNTSTNSSFPYNFDNEWDSEMTLTEDVIVESIFFISDFTDQTEFDTYIPKPVEISFAISRNGRNENIEFDVVSRSRSN